MPRPCLPVRRCETFATSTNEPNSRPGCGRLLIHTSSATYCVTPNQCSSFASQECLQLKPNSKLLRKPLQLRALSMFLD
jgi:hypothetical protein